MTPVGERLFVLSSEEPLSEDLHFTAVAVETLVSVLREQFHYVIVDVPRIPAAPYRRALEYGRFPRHGRRPDLAVGARHGAAARWPWAKAMASSAISSSSTATARAAGTP